MKKLFALILSIAIIGCATSYKPLGFSGGFSETQLDRNVFQVSFKGNGFTSTERANDLALLRSAELTLRNGFSYFVVVDGQTNTHYSVFTTPTQTYTTASATAFGNTAYGSATSTTTGGDSYVIEKPRASTTIVCFDDKPDTNYFVFNARFVYGSLSQKYGVHGD